MTGETQEQLDLGRDLTDFLKRQNVALTIMRWAERVAELHEAWDSGSGPIPGPKVTLPSGQCVRFHYEVWTETHPGASA